MTVMVVVMTAMGVGVEAMKDMGEVDMVGDIVTAMEEVAMGVVSEYTTYRFLQGADNAIY